MTGSSTDTGRVLVVDDQTPACALTQSFLDSAGYELETVDRAEALVDAFVQCPAELVLLSFQSEKAAALAALQQLRGLPRGAMAAVVLLTADVDESTERRALELGADDSWSWSLSRTELCWRVRALLRLKRAHPQLQSSELLRSQRDSMVELHQRREETLALLVHDMKNPLSGVISNAEFLSTATDLDSDQAASAQDILQASRRLHRMVLSLLDVSLSEQGQLLPTFELLTAQELLSETRATCSGRLRDKHIDLQLRVPDGGLSAQLRADRDMLLRVLANLVDNAITASTAGASIELAVVVHADTLEFRISDTGSVASADHDQLLEELTCDVARPDPRPRQRRGLGLRACRVLTEVHAGEITVEARPPSGTTIRVQLPRHV